MTSPSKKRWHRALRSIHNHPLILRVSFSFIGLGLLAGITYLYADGDDVVDQLRAQFYAARPAPPSLQALATSTSNVNYCTSQDSHQTLDLYQPKNQSAQALPVVVYIHGGGWRRGNKTDPIVGYYGSSFITAGFALAAVNYRLAPQYTYPTPNDDVACALTFLHTQAATYHLDTKRIVLFGDSAGGELAAYAAISPRYQTAAWHDSIRGVIDFYGVSDFTTIIDGTYLDRSARAYLGPNYRQIAVTASPTGMAGNQLPPFWLIHGSNDRVVPVSQSKILNQFLQDHGAQSSFIEVPGAGHGFGPHANPPPSTIRRLITQFAADRFASGIRSP